MIDDVLLADDAAMIEAMKLSHRHLGLVFEPSGAAGLEALLASKEQFAGKTVTAILCDGNLAHNNWLHGCRGAMNRYYVSAKTYPGGY